MDFVRLEVMLIWKQARLTHLFSKDVSDLLLEFYQNGPYDEDTCEHYWTLEYLRAFGKGGEESGRKLKFLLFVLGCNRESWINDFHHIYPTLEYRWVVIRSFRTHWVKLFNYVTL